MVAVDARLRSEMATGALTPSQAATAAWARAAMACKATGSAAALLHELAAYLLPNVGELSAGEVATMLAELATAGEQPSAPLSDL